MEIFEITGFQTGVSRDGVNFLQPSDSFSDIENGYIYRQVLQSRKGFSKFSNGYDAGAGATGHLPTRVMGIFQHIVTETSTEVTLAVDKNFLYKYNSGTNEFDRIPFGGSLVAFAGFNISSNDFYVSGTTYPTKDNTERFVFTGKGMPGVYFYDGTNVLNFTDAADNPDYEAFVSGDIAKSTHVFWFGERLNFVAPTIGNIFYPQGMLYSAIRDGSGNGDKFNTVGSGLLQLDTYEYIEGARILGNKIILNVNRSNWLIEKTRDPFNPYFSKKIPSVIGTDAAFSSVAWNDEVRSIGRTGIIKTDSRESLRIDNKIPYFTIDEIDPNNFDLVYGGYNRETAQFLWAYLSDTSTSLTQDKVLTSNYEEKTWSVYDMRFSCFGETVNGQNLTWDDVNENGKESWRTWDTTEEIWDKIGLTAERFKTLAGDDLGFIYELNVDYDDYVVAIQGISKATEAVITTEDQALQVGDKVIFEGVEGMTEMNGKRAIVIARTLGSITVNVDSSDFTTYTTGGQVSKIIEFSAKINPFNPYRDRGDMVRISHIEFLLDTNGGSIFVDLYADGEDSPFKEGVLVETTSTQKQREFVAIQVNHTMDFMTMQMRQASASDQVKITSIRIHAEPAGETTD